MLSSDPLVQKLLSLELPPQDFAVFGSGPLFAAGLIDELGHDLDLIARGEAWKSVSAICRPVPVQEGHGQVIALFDGQIEIFNSWGPGLWFIDQLIDEADVIEGIRFVALRYVLVWKLQVFRPKDVGHINLILGYFRKKGIKVEF